MKSFKFLALTITAGVFLFVTSCSSNKKEKNNDQSRSDSVRIVPVKTAIVKMESIMRRIEFTATLIPFEEVHLAPSAPGRIEKINVEIGDNVKQGEVIAYMDRTNLNQAHINLMKVKADFKRLDTLKKTKSIADQQYDQMKSAYDIAENTYQSLLENTQLKAPFSGLISGKYFEDGEIYSGSPVASVGKPAILSIVQINYLKALIGVSANYYPILTARMKAEINADLYPDLIFPGEVYRIYPTIDNATKTFTVEIKIQNEKLKLRPGMFSKIKLDLGKGNAILIPGIALVKQTGTDDMYVFLNKNSVAVKTAVKTGRMIDDKIEILSGLSEGDEIIIIGQNKLENQTPISVIK